MDTLVGPASNDTFNATDATLTAGDTITGGSGNDTLSVIAANSSAFSASPSMSGVENVTVSELGSSTAEINLVYATDVAKVTSKLSGTDVTFSKIQSAAKVVANGTTANKTIATFKDSLASGTNDTVALVVDGGATASFQVGGVTKPI